PKKHPSSCTTFSLYVRLSMNSFFFRPRSARPHKALLPESECKGTTFYRKHQTFLNKNRKNIHQ
ncbi:hypothetical protein, partial [Paraprevotella clara]|uniref:hypothetical protein n=1 Tax=Paraprevotella clara TaxID=454154 RepID=UPI003AB580D6